MTIKRPYYRMDKNDSVFDISGTFEAVNDISKDDFLDGVELPDDEYIRGLIDNGSIYMKGHHGSFVAWNVLMDFYFIFVRQEDLEYVIEPEDVNHV